MFGKKRKIKKEEALNKLKNDETQRLQIEQHIAEFHVQLSSLQKKGLHNKDEWQSVLSNYKVTALTALELETIEKSGVPLTKSAYPVEFNRALTSFIQIAAQETEALLLELKNSESVAMLHHFKDELSSIKQVTLLSYIEQAKPKMNVSAIFQNAAPSLNQYSKYATTDKVESIKCKTCGAARLETDQYDVCFYCGTPLFE